MWGLLDELTELDTQADRYPMTDFFRRISQTSIPLLAFVVLAHALWGGSAWARQPDGVTVIGRLAVEGTADDIAQQAIRNGLRDLGYVEGRDFRIEYRSAQGRTDQLPVLAAELVRLSVDVIVTGTDLSTRAAQQATNTIPIVAILPDYDPVASGFIESYNHPGGNITGLTVRSAVLAGKRLELFKEMLPGVSRIAVLWDPFVILEVKELQSAAKTLGIKLLPMQMKPPYDFDAAFANIKRQNGKAVMLLSSPEVYVRRTQIGALALKHRLPAEASFRDLTAAGGLMSYSTDFQHSFGRASYFIDRLMKGAKAADLPFEQTENIELVVNMRTAKTLGLAIPDTVLFRANEVIR